MTADGKANAEVRTGIEDWAAALRAKDIDGIMASHSADVLAFDCHSQLQFNGADAYRRYLGACMPHMQGPMVFELHDLNIVAQDDVAFCHYLALCGATGADGAEHRCWLGGTTCLRRTRGTWRIVYAHCSAPFDPMSGRAMLDLTPQGMGRADAA
jgi:ketosteroid isomerase-like protein